MYAMRICAPGIDCKVNNPGIANRVVCELLDNIYYNEEYRRDVITLHDIESGIEEDFAEIRVDTSDIIHINTKTYCLPDAVGAIGEIICKHFGR